MSERRIGFYRLLSQEDRFLMGALLVTDELGKPEEFRVTYPVKPTLIQRQLYGNSLISHVGVELCGLPLVEALKQRPELIVVSQPQFLSMGDAVPATVVHLDRAGTTLVASSASDESSTTRKVQSESGRFEPLLIAFPLSYKEEVRNAATASVADFFRGFDLLEPFNRIAVALRTLQESDERFR
ncbi:MAG: hypothetical protein KDD78_15645 [Caldilineaceae bacterium]|nr:hypothetical protein [Caldilineaceae bacterium]